MVHARWIAFLSAGMALAADYNPRQVLERVTAKVASAAKAIPNYTCVETVERDFYRPAGSGKVRGCPLPEERTASWLVSTDRLRLDVAMVKQGEIFSWVGASHFNDADVGQLVREGPMGTGAFAAFLTLVFAEDKAQFEFQRKLVAEDGRDLLEYSFQVRKDDSHYKVKVKDGWVLTAYSGGFRVDPAAQDVVRMWVNTAELPPETNQCAIETDMDYGISKIGDAPVLLTTHARQRFVYLNSEQTVNTTTFASCREYRGESTISFEEAPPDGAPVSTANAPARPASVPAGLRFTLELTQPIDSAMAAAGDRFAARLVSPLRDAKNKVLARGGAMVEGRLLRVQSYHLKPAEVVVVLKPEGVEIGGVKVPLTAIRDVTREVAEARRQGKKSIPIALPRPGEEQAGLFRFGRERTVMGKGFRSDWETR